MEQDTQTLRFLLWARMRSKLASVPPWRVVGKEEHHPRARVTRQFRPRGVTCRKRSAKNVQGRRVLVIVTNKPCNYHGIYTSYRTINSHGVGLTLPVTRVVEEEEHQPCARATEMRDTAKASGERQPFATKITKLGERHSRTAT